MICWWCHTKGAKLWKENQQKLSASVTPVMLWYGLGFVSPHRVHLCNTHVSRFWTFPVLLCPISETEKNWPVSTWLLLIFTYNGDAQEETSHYSKNRVLLCKHINFALELIYLLTCSLTFTLSTVTILFWER